MAPKVTVRSLRAAMVQERLVSQVQLWLDAVRAQVRFAGAPRGTTIAVWVVQPSAEP